MKNRKIKSNDDAGMTLVEVLVALFVLALVTASMPLICGTIARAKSAADAANEQGRAVGAIYHELDAIDWQKTGAEAEASAVMNHYPHFTLKNVKRDDTMTTVTFDYDARGMTRAYEQIFYTPPESSEP